MEARALRRLLYAVILGASSALFPGVALAQTTDDGAPTTPTQPQSALALRDAGDDDDASDEPDAAVRSVDASVSTDAGVQSALTPDPPTGRSTEFTFTGWSEIYYAYNFNAPSNGVNAYRIYDSLHDHIAFNNFALDLGWKVESVAGHATLQLGAIAADAYYPAATLPRAQQELLWRVLQEVTFGWNPRILGGRPLTLDAGLFVAPFGVEYVQIYKNWNWSPSNLFYIAPFQMTGVRASWEFDDRLTVRAGVYSGWDRVVDDNNSGKSVLLQAEYTRGEALFMSLQYMLGVERDRSAPEGSYVRHTVDHYGDWQFNRRLQFRWHLFTGLEPNRLGTSAWLGGALYARVMILPWLFTAVRAEILHEWVPTRGTSLFHLDAASSLGEGTFTVELLPHRHVSLRVEYRHDHANGNMFFLNNVPRNRMAGYDIPNANSQDTVSVGATAWF